MKSVIKRVVACLISVAVILGMCGCSSYNEGVDIKQKMVRYMNEKYSDDTFEFKNVTGEGAGSDTQTIVVSSQKYPDTDIYVRRVNGETSYTDNYLSVAYEDQTKELIGEVLDQVFQCDYLLIYDVNRYACPNVDGTMSFEKYVSTRESGIGFVAISGYF